MPIAQVTSPSTGDTAGTDDAPDNPPEPGGPLRRSNPSGSRTENQVEIIWAAPGSCAVDLRWLDAKLVAVCTNIGRPVARLAVRIVGDAEMSRLHETHAGEPGTTDVLTFDNTPGSDAPLDVDIAVCVDEATRQESELGHSTDRELLLYAVHGLLHCLGFDDHTEPGYARMHAEEDRLLQSVGVEPTFAPQRKTNNKTE